MRNSSRLLLGVLAALAAGSTWAEELNLYVDKKDVPAGYREKIILEVEGPTTVSIEPRFFASLGRIDRPQKISDRKWRALLELPPLRHPLLVLVAARVPGWTPAWGAIRLHAPVSLPVKTDKPHVNVTLMLGGRQYGPVRTDDNGNCLIGVEVWPGEFEARAHGVDEFGNKTQQKVAIPIPPSVLTLALAEQERLPADGQAVADIWVLQARPDGRPRERADYAVRLNTGKLLDTVRRAPGVFRTRVRAPRGRETDRLVCEIIDKLQPEARIPPLELALTAGTPHAIKYEIEPSRLFSDGQSQARIRLRVLDRGENPVAGFVPRVSCPVGALGQIKPQDDAYEVYYLPETGQQGAVTCSAVVGENAAVRADFTLFLKKPTVAALEAFTEVSGLVADGRSQAIIRLRARGDNGRPLAGAEIKGSASLGLLSLVIGDGEGDYHAVYTAPAAAAVEKVRLEFSALGPEGEVSTWVALRLEPPPPPPAPVPWLGIGLRGGLSVNFAQLTTPAFFLEAFSRLPFGRQLLFAGVEGGYVFDRSRRDPRDGGAPDALVELDARQLAAVFQLRLASNGLFRFFADTGAGAVFFSWRIKPEGASEMGSAVRPLVFAGLGGEMRLGAGALVMEARYSWARLPSGRLGDYLSGNYSGLQVLAGLRYFVF